MATDRGAILTIRAAARGIIDFSKTRLRDVNWWRRTNLLIEAMADADDLIELQAAYAYQLALVGNGNLKPDSFDTAQKKAKELFNDIANMARPWVAKADRAGGQQEVAVLIDTYKRVIGDPNDPEVKKLLQVAIDLLNRRDIPKETDDDLVSRRMVEREKKLRQQRR